MKLAMLRLGGAELRRRAARGELDRATLWAAMQGASKYAAAIVAGDVAGDDLARERVGVCRECPAAMCGDQTLGEGLAAVSVCGVYCGEPLTPGPDTCGCLVGQVEGGEVQPAGKTLVGSESCPQKKW